MCLNSTFVLHFIPSCLGYCKWNGIYSVSKVIWNDTENECFTINLNLFVTKIFFCFSFNLVNKSECLNPMFHSASSPPNLKWYLMYLWFSYLFPLLLKDSKLIVYTSCQSPMPIYRNAKGRQSPPNQLKTVDQLVNHLLHVLPLKS